MFIITERQIDYKSLIDKVSSPQAGAIATFLGVSRNFTQERKVNYLFYEAYHSMALLQMAKVGALTRQKFSILKIAITHRIGKVDVEEASVLIAISASHRHQALDACHFAIDCLKDIVPIWKKEFMTDGSEKWIANRSK